MYSKSKEKRLLKKVMWPDLRYGPNGECKLFSSAHEVPEGWTAKPDIPYVTPEQLQLDKDKLAAELTSRGIDVHPTWGKAHMKKMLDHDRSTIR